MDEEACGLMLYIPEANLLGVCVIDRPSDLHKSKVVMAFHYEVFDSVLTTTEYLVQFSVTTEVRQVYLFVSVGCQHWCREEQQHKGNQAVKSAFLQTHRRHSLFKLIYN